MTEINMYPIRADVNATHFVCITWKWARWNRLEAGNTLRWNTLSVLYTYHALSFLFIFRLALLLGFFQKTTVISNVVSLKLKEEEVQWRWFFQISHICFSNGHRTYRRLFSLVCCGSFVVTDLYYTAAYTSIPKIIA